MGEIESPDKGKIDRSKENKEFIEREVAWFKEKYGIEIETIQKKEELQSGLWKKYYINPPSAENIIKLLKELKDQIIRLPSSLIQKANLKKIVLCGDIEVRKIDDEKKVSYKHGFTMTGLDSLSVYIRSSFCLYHELYHKIASIENEEFSFQMEINASVSSDLLEGMSEEMKKSFTESAEKIADAKRKTMEWKKLDPNDEDFNLEVYNEERANYFGYLLNTDKKDWYFDEKDPTLPAKVTAMKEFMKKWSGGVLDDQFFEDIKAGKVDERYWDERLKKK